MINRKTREEVSFVDFEADVLEPKYLTFKVEANDFLMPSSVGSSPNPSVSSVQIHDQSLIEYPAELASASPADADSATYSASLRRPMLSNRKCGY